MFNDRDKETFFIASTGATGEIAQRILKEHHYDVCLAIRYYIKEKQDRMYLMSNIVASAIGELEDIADAKPQTYVDTLQNVLNRPRNARRPMTMKDAKRIASFNAKQLRKVWQFLDPTGN